MNKNLLRIATCIIGASLVGQAAEVTVTSPLDDGSAGTLRYYANTVASGSTIYIPSGMTITLSGPIVTRYRLSIIGQGDGATLVGGGTTNLITGTIPSYNQSCSLYLQRLTLTNGHAGAEGGAVFRFGNTSYSPLPVHFRDCRIVGNHATGSGGFVNTSGGIFTFTNCIVAGNTAANGGVFGFNNNSYSASGVYLASNTVFSSNAALSGGGGCFGKTWDKLHLVDCVITNNTSTAGGAFAAVRGDWRPSLSRFENCHFVDNEAGGEGGVISGIYPADGGTLFRNCVIRGNRAPRGSLIDGRGRHRFENCLVENNVSHTAAAWYSAGLFKTQLSSGGYYNYLFTNCVVRGNANTAGGNAILWAYGNSTAPCSFEACNTLFESNTANGTVIASPSGYTTRLAGCSFVGNGVGGGNALFAIDGTLPVTMTNTTFFGNRSGSTSLLYVNNTGTVDIVSCTIVSNTLGTTSSTSGAIYNNKGATANVRVVNTVVALNRNANAAIRDVYGALSTLRYSAFSCPAGAMDASTSLFGLTAAPLDFGLFGENETTIRLCDGNALPTLAIGRGSVLRDKIGMPPASPTDARGMPRPDRISGIADIGAYEYQPIRQGSLISVR